MSGIIKTLKNKTNDIEQNVYPKTVLEAVVDSETNETLDIVLAEINDKINNVEISGESPVENLLVYPYAISNETTDNYTIVDNGDGTLTISCNFPELSMANVQIVSEQPISAGTYTVSGCSENFTDSTVNINVYVDDTSGNRIHYGNVSYGQNFTFTVTELCYLSISLWFNSGASLTNAVLKPMLELGTVAHDFKPYKDVSKANQTDVDNKVSKSGDTMTGELNVKNNVNVPILADNTGDGLAPIPVAGTCQADGLLLTDHLPTIKSWMGSFYGIAATGQTSNTWNNIISSRHRNGVSNGTKYGMYFRSALTSTNSNLVWNRQYAEDTWQGERTILDNNNYSNYNTYPYGTYASHASSIKWGTAGYVVLAKITVIGAWCSGEYVEFKINSIGRNDGYVRIALSNTPTVSATTVSSASCYNTAPMYYVLTQNSNNVVIELIGYKQTYENFTITDVKLSHFLYDGKLSISYPNTFETSLRSSAVEIEATNPWTIKGGASGSSLNLRLASGCVHLVAASSDHGMGYVAIIVPAYGTTSGIQFYEHNKGVSGSGSSSISGTTLTITFSGATTISYKLIRLV